jgi:hypothetical protein
MRFVQMFSVLRLFQMLVNVDVAARSARRQSLSALKRAARDGDGELQSQPAEYALPSTRAAALAARLRRSTSLRRRMLLAFVSCEPMHITTSHAHHGAQT